MESLRPLRDAGVVIVVGDSGSTDGSLEMMDSWGVNRVVQVPRGNMYRAINAALATNTDWEWATYLNGDDIIYHDQTAQMLNKLTDEADLVYGDIDYIDSVGRYLHTFRSPGPNRLAALLSVGINPIPQQGTWFSRGLFNENCGFDSSYRYSGDFDFFMRSISHGARVVKHSTSTVAAFRIHGQQLSQKYVDEMKHEDSRSIRSSGLRVSKIISLRTKVGFRFRNIDQYICRFIRRYHLSRKISIPRTMDF